MSGPSPSGALPGAAPLILDRGTVAWLLPAVLALAALVSRATGLDAAIEDALFDPVRMRFPWRSSIALEVIGHQALRSLATLVWGLLLLAALVSLTSRFARPWRRLLIATTCAMALGPVVVVALKAITTFPCPWSLVRYGGFALEVDQWFTRPALAGRCFPAGHAAGGFSFIALAFGLAAAGHRSAATAALGVTLALGTAASAVRMAQGAHFLSHTLWSAAIDWAAAVIVFRWLAPRG